MPTDFWTNVEKRRSPSDAQDDEIESSSKRQRTETLEPEPLPGTSDGSGSATAKAAAVRPNADDIGRHGLRRSVALALQHVGFDSTSTEALESFTATVETYLATLIEHTKNTAEASRRARPTPQDFDLVLQRYEFPISDLKPHLKKNPVSKEMLTPSVYDPIPIPKDADYFRSLSTKFLGKELDGNVEKEEKIWIPKSLPAFPSKHTYKFTPVEAKVQDLQQRREKAAADAKQSEKALRRISKAAKASKQKELRELAQRDAMSRQRHGMWEQAMKEYFPRKDQSVEDLTQEIADHSVIVDYTAAYARKELPRVRSQLETLASKG